MSVDDAKEYYINDKSLELIAIYQSIKTQDTNYFKYIKALNKYWHILENIVDKHIENLLNIFCMFRNNEISEIELDEAIISFVNLNAQEFNGMLSAEYSINEQHFLYEIQKNVRNKMKRMKKIELTKGIMDIDDIKMNIETGFKGGFYMHLRHLYNHAEKYNLDKGYYSAIFYFIREYCYSSMFRYNKSGGFNVPYGGSSYNKKYLDTKIKYMQSIELIDKLNNTEIFSKDFEDFIDKYKLTDADFIFLDPPYDTVFSTYANNNFENNDQIRLANFCKTTKAKFMLVIKNTDFIYNLYKDFNVISFDKKYTVSFQNRNDKKAEHLLITNY